MTETVWPAKPGPLQKSVPTTALSQAKKGLEVESNQERLGEGKEIKIQEEGERKREAVS